MGSCVVEQQEWGYPTGPEQGGQGVDNRVHQQTPAREWDESGPASSQEETGVETATYNIGLRSALEISKPTR